MLIHVENELSVLFAELAAEELLHNWVICSKMSYSCSYIKRQYPTHSRLDDCFTQEALCVLQSNKTEWEILSTKQRTCSKFTSSSGHNCISLFPRSDLRPSEHFSAGKQHWKEIIIFQSHRTIHYSMLPFIVLKLSTHL